jgi:3-hydroxyisobutyrate dehydrogenase-like beta-hydroxyacid dehydrogenase
MMGGDVKDVEKVTPVIECFAKKVYHFGPVGKYMSDVLVGVRVYTTI